MCASHKQAKDAAQRRSWTFYEAINSVLSIVPWDVNIINIKIVYHKFIKNQVVKAKGMMDKTPW